MQNGVARLSKLTRSPKHLLLLHFLLRAIEISEDLPIFDILAKILGEELWIDVFT